MKEMSRIGERYNRLLELLVLAAAACLTISYFGGYYLIITTVGHHARLLDKIAFALLLCKVLGTRYSKKEFAAVLVLAGLAIANYRFSGNTKAMVNILMILSLKNVDLQKVFRTALASLLAIALTLAVLAALGITGDLYRIMDYGRGSYEKRYRFGYLHANQWAHAMFMIVLLSVLSLKEQIKWPAAGMLLLFSIGVFVLSGSRTSLLVSAGVLVLAMLYRYFPKLMYSAVMKGMIFAGTVTVWVFPLLGIGDHAVGRWIREDFPIQFNRRLYMNKEFYDLFGDSLFGVKLQDTIVVDSSEIVLDMGYMRFFLENGWVLYLLFFAAVLLLLHCGMKHRKEKLLIGTLTVLIYAFSENTAFSSVQANVIMYFFAYLLYGNQLGKSAMTCKTPTDVL